MEGRKWEDLNEDCLVNALGRVGIESLLMEVPFVCKSWFKATLNPLCWRHLVFPQITHLPWYTDSFTSRLIREYRLQGRFSVTALVKSLIKRSDRSITHLKLPGCCSEEALFYAADECPNLRTLVIPYDFSDEHMFKIPNLVTNWKKLEFLKLGISCQIKEIIAQISIHCKNFVGLAIKRAQIEKNEATAIVTLLPNINYLGLKEASIQRQYLVMILKGCKKLEYVDVRMCLGFDEGDGDILKLASHIRTFRHEGSHLVDLICFSYIFYPDGYGSG
ncbi:F-box/LRR-repeat protein [Camellia lanceoleosa]|uniref:F-box/LRR-repeat protein n=1 Tax=Camellia lanceoleosa TaxID=1840588 RepID=A0ACC0GWC1_9ERIC|nr:F-box/LRR-repeat protein [Camellia lanceoleosa]